MFFEVTKAGVQVPAAYLPELHQVNGVLMHFCREFWRMCQVTSIEGTALAHSRHE